MVMRRAILVALVLLGGCPRYYSQPWHDTTSVAQFAVDPADPGTLLAIHAGRIERSTNAGASWAATPPGPTFYSIGWVGSLIWAAGSTATSGVPTVYTSADGGLTYVAVAALPTSANSSQINAIGVDATNAAHAVLALDAPSGGQVFTTTDAGSTWTTATIQSDVVGYQGGPQRVAFDPANGSSVLVCYFQTIYQSFDGGDTFGVNSLTAPQGFTDVAVLGSTIYAATIPDVLASVDSGNTWTQRSLTPYATASGSSYPLFFALDPASGTLWVSASDGIYVSTDGAQTFSYVFYYGGAPIALAPSNPRIVYTGGYATSDGGMTWAPLGPFDYAPY